MPSYIFLTREGLTFQPDSDSEEPDIENLQVIGFSKAKTPDEAYRKLLEDSPYLLETAFDDIFSYKLARDYEQTRVDFSLKDTLQR